MLEIRNSDEFESQDDMMAYLIETGSLYVAGLDDDLEFIYQVNEEICKVYAPWYWKDHMLDTENYLIGLLENGYVEIVDFDHEEGAIYGLTDKGREYIQSATDQ